MYFNTPSTRYSTVVILMICIIMQWMTSFFQCECLQKPCTTQITGVSGAHHITLGTPRSDYMMSHTHHSRGNEPR